MKPYDLLRAEGFKYFNKHWEEFIQSAETLGFSVREVPLRHCLEFKKEPVCLEVSKSILGYHGIYIKSPFHWSETFHIREHKLEFETKTRSRVLELLLLLENDEWFEKMTLKNDIQSKIGAFNDLTLEQIKEIDKETLHSLEQAFDFLESLVAKPPAKE